MNFRFFRHWGSVHRCQFEFKSFLPAVIGKLFTGKSLCNGEIFRRLGYSILSELSQIRLCLVHSAFFLWNQLISRTYPRIIDFHPCGFIIPAHELIPFISRCGRTLCNSCHRLQSLTGIAHLAASFSFVFDGNIVIFTELRYIRLSFVHSADLLRYQLVVAVDPCAVNSLTCGFIIPTVELISRFGCRRRSLRCSRSRSDGIHGVIHCSLVQIFALIFYGYVSLFLKLCHICFFMIFFICRILFRYKFRIG